MPASSKHSWAAMIQRCQNENAPNYHRYGGRGITVCDRWQYFSNFLADMGEKPIGLTLDRIDNDGNYEPSNCKWSTWSEQARNRRNRLSRKLFCKNGHQFTATNTLVLPDGERVCRECARARNRAYDHRKRAVV